MVDFVAVDFRPLKGGEPDADDLKAADFQLRHLATKHNLASPIRKRGPTPYENGGVTWYTIEWHGDERPAR
jgi:hypothetical protein